MKIKNRKLITYKNKIIRKKSEKVKIIDNEIKEIITNMNHIISKHNGIGLAAVQIGILKRIICIDLTKNTDEKIIKPVRVSLVNPVILSTSERREYAEEGCLSVPGKKGEVMRYFWVEIEGHTPNGEKIHKKLYDLAARVAQHEIDHLEGVLFIDKIMDKSGLESGHGNSRI